jgi:hypothetical protein
MKNKFQISNAVKESKYYKLLIHFIFVHLIVLNICSSVYAQDSSTIVRAGLRSSTYGINPFPDTTWWYNVTSDMAARYPGPLLQLYGFWDT